MPAAWMTSLISPGPPNHAFGADDAPLITFPFPFPSSEWVISAERYWVALAKRPSPGMGQRVSDGHLPAQGHRGVNHGESDASTQAVMSSVRFDEGGSIQLPRSRPDLIGKGR